MKNQTSMLTGLMCFSPRTLLFDCRKALILSLVFAFTNSGAGGLRAQTLAGWDVSGGPLIWSSARQSALPAGAHLSRRFSGAKCDVRLISRPYFGQLPASAPSLDVGQMSISFIRSSSETGIVLVGRDAGKLALPIMLGADGRSVDPLELVIRYDSAQGQAEIAILSNTLWCSFDLSADREIDLFLWSGDSADWLIRSISVDDLTDSPAAVGPREETALAPSKPAETGQTDVPAKTLAELPALRLELRRSLARADEVAVDRQLAVIVATRATSAAGYIETAWLLKTLAFELASEGYNSKGAHLAASRALSMSNKARELAIGRPGLQSIAWRITGMVQKDFDGDLPAAEASFRRALDESPGDSMALAAVAEIEQSLTRSKGANR